MADAMQDYENADNNLGIFLKKNKDSTPVIPKKKKPPVGNDMGIVTPSILAYPPGAPNAGNAVTPQNPSTPTNPRLGSKGQPETTSMQRESAPAAPLTGAQIESSFGVPQTVAANVTEKNMKEYADQRAADSANFDKAPVGNPPSSPVAGSDTLSKPGDGLSILGSALDSLKSFGSKALEAAGTPSGSAGLMAMGGKMMEEGGKWRPMTEARTPLSIVGESLGAGTAAANAEKQRQVASNQLGLMAEEKRAEIAKKKAETESIQGGKGQIQNMENLQTGQKESVAKGSERERELMKLGYLAMNPEKDGGKSGGVKVSPQADETASALFNVPFNNATQEQRKAVMDKIYPSLPKNQIQILGDLADKDGKTGAAKDRWILEEGARLNAKAAGEKAVEVAKAGKNPLSDKAVEAQLVGMLKTGKSWLGFGSAKAKEQIANALPEYLEKKGFTAEEAMVIAADFQADRQSRTWLTKQSDAVNRGAEQFTLISDYLDKASKALNNGDFKSLNALKNGYFKATGDSRANTADIYNAAAGREWMKLVTGSINSISELTATAQTNVSKMLNSDLSYPVVHASLGAIGNEINATRKSYADQLANIDKRMSAPIVGANTQTKPAFPGAKLTDKAVVAEYMQKAGNDRNKARELAKKDGWTF
jgi:hypothetical protein